MECANCGAEIIDPNQAICEKCGARLVSKIKSTKKEIIKGVTAPVLLFDIDRNFYILSEKYWHNGSTKILDEKNQLIGNIKKVLSGIKRGIELLEVDGTMALAIQSKILSTRGAQDLKDPQGNLIARIKKKILSAFKPKIFLVDSSGTRLYEAQGNFMSWSYKVSDMSGKVIAEIEKADKLQDAFNGVTLDLQDKYVIKILNNETDRRILVGFVFSIDIMLHDF